MSHSPTEPPHDHQLLTVHDLAKRLKVSIRTIWRMRTDGRLPPPLQWGTIIRWPQPTIDAWLQSSAGQRARPSTKRHW